MSNRMIFRRDLYNRLQNPKLKLASPCFPPIRVHVQGEGCEVVLLREKILKDVHFTFCKWRHWSRHLPHDPRANISNPTEDHRQTSSYALLPRLTTSILNLKVNPEHSNRGHAHVICDVKTWGLELWEGVTKKRWARIEIGITTRLWSPANFATILGFCCTSMVQLYQQIADTDLDCNLW